MSPPSPRQSADAAAHAEELHTLPPDTFLDEVHSFEFWFQSVEGYLSDKHYGHAAHPEAAPLEEDERDRLITILANYCAGETIALEGAAGMIGFAPNRNAKIFLATQVADEARHLEVLLHRLRDLGVRNPETALQGRVVAPLGQFKARLVELVAARDWDAAVFAQNVILEAMEYTVFQTHAGRADPITREVLEGIVSDERRHMGFGENDLGRRLIGRPELREHLLRIKRELDPLVIATFEQTVAKLAIPAEERPELGRSYLAAVDRLGLAR